MINLHLLSSVLPNRSKPLPLIEENEHKNKITVKYVNERIFILHTQNQAEKNLRNINDFTNALLKYF